jgi:hypothetical protein
LRNISSFKISLLDEITASISKSYQDFLNQSYKSYASDISSQVNLAFEEDYVSLIYSNKNHNFVKAVPARLKPTVGYIGY